jgi:hypothetical protein
LALPLNRVATRLPAAGAALSPPADDDAKVSFAAIKEGFRFLKGKRVLQSTSQQAEQPRTDPEPHGHGREQGRGHPEDHGVEVDGVTSIAQTVVSDEMRGRLEGMGLTVWATGPALGDIEAGVVASAVSVPFSIVSGGLACLVGVGVIAAAVPEFRAYDARNPTA